MGGPIGLFGESRAEKEARRETERLRAEQERMEEEERRKKLEAEEKALRSAGRGGGGRLTQGNEDGLNTRLG